MKRIYVVVLTVILMFTNIPVLAQSELMVSGDFAYYIEDGNARIVWNVGDNKDLVIPSEIDGYPVIGFGLKTPGHSGTGFDKDIKSVVISEGVKYIGNGMFKGCSELTSVKIPNSVTYIGEFAFYQCRALKSIIIPESVIAIGECAFGGCTSLETADVFSNILGDWMFSACTNLTTVNLYGEIETISDAAFRRCNSLQNIKIPESVTTIEEEAFYDCTALSTVTLPESVTKLDHGVFERCENLTSVIFNNPDIDFEEESKTEWVMDPKTPTFTGCDNLTTVYAFNNSQAQRYATEKKIKHVPLARVKLNGQNVKFDMPPIIENGRTLVPMRTIFETLGAKVDWHDETSTVTALADDKTITMQIGNTQMNANGRAVKLDVAPKVINDRTLVPVRAVSESLGATVEWDDATQTVIINVQ